MKRLLILILVAGVLGGLSYVSYNYKQQLADAFTPSTAPEVESGPGESGWLNQILRGLIRPQEQY